MHKALLVSHPMQKTIGQKGKKKACFQPRSRRSKRTDGTKKPKATWRFKANDIKNTQRVNTFNIPFTKEITKLDARFNSILPTRNL